jgi:hypothetical protein
LNKLEHAAMFYWIYDIPTESMAILFAVVFVGFYWAGCILLRPVLRMFVRAREGTNEVVGNVLSCFCVFYGLLLGLLAVAAYQNYSQVESNVANEASSLNALYRDVASYREPHGQIARLLRLYGQVCVARPEARSDLRRRHDQGDRIPRTTAGI